MTRRLSGIWHAWHFQFALGSVVTVLCGSFCIACLHPLTQRYATFTLRLMDEDRIRCNMGFSIT
ncbi:DUF3265 domain-containing protein [Vibrio vulnificus]|nr:DUF3265 domain-containing protein [Vibrio vulnificus]MBF4499518.1 DUF3265 domain-containing protein [Vibrio vulnificus]MBL6179081.1 DUF3265 domain-containing protein [Vibrio vulnificus]HDY7983806.1 DUF3265 domain-containing protein [Vibrio vulnificus]HDY8007276.1 DUF3265 domain-containing protein [Vibrio vulnificus]